MRCSRPSLIPVFPAGWPRCQKRKAPEFSSFWIYCNVRLVSRLLRLATFDWKRAQTVEVRRDRVLSIVHEHLLLSSAESAGVLRHPLSQAWEHRGDVGQGVGA